MIPILRFLETGRKATKNFVSVSKASSSILSMSWFLTWSKMLSTPNTRFCLDTKAFNCGSLNAILHFWVKTMIFWSLTETASMCWHLVQSTKDRSKTLTETLEWCTPFRHTAIWNLTLWILSCLQTKIWTNEKSRLSKSTKRQKMVNCKRVSWTFTRSKLICPL